MATEEPAKNGTSEQRGGSPSLARLRPWFTAMSAPSKTLFLAALGAIALGIAGAVGEDVWAALKAMFMHDPAVAQSAPEDMPIANNSPPTRTPHEIPEDEKRAMFSKLYPGAEYSGPILPYEDGSFASVAEEIGLLAGDWQGAYNLPINRRLTKTRLKFVAGKLMTGEVILPSCSAQFIMFRADNLDNITFRKTGDTGGSPCSQMVALQMNAPSGTIATMALSMADGSTTGQGPVNKAFAP